MVSPIIIACDKSSSSQFVIAHYPGSVQALYEWTPDECTIEFYMHDLQPSIFESMHKDMPDLLVPPWCENNDAFVAYHRRLLESESVSRRLHLWIDLFFGEALTGQRAIAEKNVVIDAVLWSNGCQEECRGTCHSLFADPHVDEIHRTVSSIRTSRSRFVQLFSFPHPRKHSDLRKTVSVAFRTAFHQGDRDLDGDRASLPSNMHTTDFQSRKLRDATTIGLILKDCYTSARVIPPPAVEEAITNLLMGTLDLQQSLKCLASDGSSTKAFPFPQQLKHVYQLFSNAQSLTFERRKCESYFGSSESTSRSTDASQVLQLIQNAHCLEPLSTAGAGLVLHTILMPLKCNSFIENSTTLSSSFGDLFHNYMVVLARKFSGMFPVPLDNYSSQILAHFNFSLLSS